MLSLIKVAVKKEMLCVFNATTLAHRRVRDILHKGGPNLVNCNPYVGVCEVSGLFLPHRISI